MTDAPGPAATPARRHLGAASSRTTAVALVAGLVGAGIGAATTYAVVDRAPGAGAATGTTTDPAAEEEATGPQRFQVDGVPFTFDYPAEFAETQPGEGVAWIAGISPVDVVDVRRVDDLTYSASGLAEVFGALLRERSDLSVTGQEETEVAGAPAVSFTVQQDVEGGPLQSRLVYFTAGEDTWQLGCQSGEDNRAVIDAACDDVVGSLTVR